MVQIAKFVALASCVSFVAASRFVKRDYSQVEATSNDIVSQVTSLDSAIQAFGNPGGTLPQALGIHTGAAKLSGTLQTWTSLTTALGSFTADQCNEQLSAVRGAKPHIVDSLTNIVAKKPAFAALPIGGLLGLIKMDLGFLGGNTTAFADAMINACPEDLRAEPTATKALVVEAFAQAIAAYA